MDTKKEKHMYWMSSILKKKTGDLYAWKLVTVAKYRVYIIKINISLYVYTYALPILLKVY